jgi:hypothetical protein
MAETDDIFSLRHTVVPHLKDHERKELSRLLQELFSDYMKTQENDNERKNQK